MCRTSGLQLSGIAKQVQNLTSFYLSRTYIIFFLYLQTLNCCNSSTVPLLNIQASVMILSSSRLGNLARNQSGSESCFYFRQHNCSLDDLNSRLLAKKIPNRTLSKGFWNSVYLMFFGLGKKWRKSCRSLCSHTIFPVEIQFNIAVQISVLKAKCTHR